MLLQPTEGIRITSTSLTAILAAVACFGSCASCRDGCASSTLEKAAAGTHERLSAVELVETSRDGLAPLAPMTRVVVEPAGISIDNIAVVQHWWNNSERSESEVLFHVRFEDLLIDRPLVAGFDDWKLDPAILRDGKGGLLAEPVNKGVRDANKVETRLARDLGEQWSSGHVAIWTGAGTPFSAIAPVIHVSAQNGYGTVDLVVRHGSILVSLPLRIQRFKARPASSDGCSPVRMHVTADGLVPAGGTDDAAGLLAQGSVCGPASISVDPDVTFAALIRALETLDEAGVGHVGILLTAQPITTLD